MARAFCLALTVLLAADRSLVRESNSPPAVDAVGQMQRLIEADWIEQDRLFSAAMVKPGEPVTVNAQGVTTREDASGAVDGIKNGRFGFHLAVGEKDPWWQVELGQDHPIDRVVIYNRTDGNHAARTRRIGIQVAGIAHPNRFQTVYRHDGAVFFGVKENQPLVVRFDERPITAGIVRLFVDGECHLALDEVEVYSKANPERNIALGKLADQKSVSRHSVPGTAGETPPREASRDGGLQLAHTRDVIRRAWNLAARLRTAADPARLDPLVAAIGRVERDLTELDARPGLSYETRRSVYFEARRLLRQIACCRYYCVDCHQERNAIDLTGAIEYRPCPRDEYKECCYTRSYNSLAEKYGFYVHAHSQWLFGSSPTSTASRTLPGGFGARASKLLQYLDQSHYGVDLPAEDFRRIVLWLDCNSEFLGAYEEAEAQARGELVSPRLH